MDRLKKNISFVTLLDNSLADDYLPNLRDFELWWCFDLMKLADGDKNGLAEVSSAFLGSEIPAGIMINFRPLGDVACEDDADIGTLTCFGVFGFDSALVELKLSSLVPNFGKLWLS